MTETQNNSISDDLINKIRGLLRLSNSSNQNEAELAMRKAKELCVKFDLDLASINPHELKVPEQPIIKTEIQMEKRLPICQTYITYLLQDHFNVRVLYGGSRYYGKHLVFIGRKRDIEVATYVNEFLNHEFLRLWRNYYKNTPGISLSHRYGYIHGLQTGLSQKLKDAQTETETNVLETKSDEVKNKYALMVVDHKKKLEEKVHEFFPKLGKRRAGFGGGNFSSFGAGVQAGKNININRPLGNGASRAALA